MCFIVRYMQGLGWCATLRIGFRYQARRTNNMNSITIPIRTAPGQNVREHHHVRAKRVRSERNAVAWMLKRVERPPLPCSVRLTRIAPSNGMDDDNLAGSVKSVRDQIAEWLGVDDKHRDQVRYVYAQCRGPWSVGIEFGEMVVDAEFVPLYASQAHA